jgi:TolA-binding protein
VIALILMEISDSTFVAPGLSLSAFAGLLALAAREYKAARLIDVEGEKERRAAAEAREKEAGTSTAARVRELSEKISSLEETVEKLRIDHERELLGERGKNFRLRLLLKDNGIEIPEELGP